VTVDVDLIVNCYERTYRRVLTPGFFDSVAQQNGLTARRHLLVNNVVTRPDAEGRAKELLASREIDSYAFVSDVIDRARRRVGVPPRALRHRPYFLDYGLAMGVTGSARWIVGWDAEVQLDMPDDWVTPSIALMERRPEIFSASPNWRDRGSYEGTLLRESFARDGPFYLNWGFSDRAFLVRRAELAGPIYRRFAPASLGRHAGHPWTFEGRVEAYQRAAKRPRATLADVRYSHPDMDEVVARLGGRQGFERCQYLFLRALRRALIHWPTESPRWRIR
jgi:hypothetical protein